MEKLKGLSLFSSGGISEYYLNYTPVEITIANELIENRCKFYRHLYPNVNMIHGDITKKKIYDKILKSSKKENIDFIMATPPCQGMSKAGKMKVSDHRNILFLYILDLIEELNPKYCLIENVPEFIKFNYIDPETQNEKNIMEKIKDTLSDNYNINFKVLDAKYFEVPQSRKRAIVLISRKDQKEWKIPKNILNDNNLLTVENTIGDLPSLESGEKYKLFTFNKNITNWHYAKKHNDNHILWMKNTPTGKSAFDNIIHYPQTKDKITGEMRKISGFKTTYKRMDWNKPAPTITMSSGSISSQNNVHPGRFNEETSTWSDARVLSIYEIILLTSLPSNLTIPDFITEKELRDLFGECVPSKFMYNIIKTLE